MAIFFKDQDGIYSDFQTGVGDQFGFQFPFESPSEEESSKLYPVVGKRVKSFGDQWLSVPEGKLKEHWEQGRMSGDIHFRGIK